MNTGSFRIKRHNVNCKMIRVCAHFPRSLGWRLLRRRSSESISKVTIEGGVAIPVYRARENESVEVLRARLQYQSRKRGMLENGLVLRCVL